MRRTIARTGVRSIAVWGFALAGAALIGLGLTRVREGSPALVSRVRLGPVAPPVPPANFIRPLTPEQALAANQKIATATEPLEVARPFVVSVTQAGATSPGAALDCLTAAIYYEAASESPQGQRAVAQVVLNRVRHPAFPKSVCGVVYQGSERTTGCQFTFTCDGSLRRRPLRAAWDRATVVAAAALNGLVEPTVGTATHYHTVWVVPYWADSLTKLTTIGAHIFYRWSGAWGKRAAFNGRYLGEAQEAALPTSVLDGIGLPPPNLDPIAAAAAPLTRLLADENKGGLALPSSAAQSTIVADGLAGRPIADDGSGMLRTDPSAGEVPTAPPR